VRRPEQATRVRLILPTLVAVSLLLGACSSGQSSRRHDPMAGLEENQRIKGPDGQTHELVGMASWYGERFHGRQTASGERYDMYAMTAAHKTLPFGTMVRVTDLETRKTVIVRITDRGPFTAGRVVDLSYAAASEIGMIQAGVVRVRLDIVMWPGGVS
jgi:rare lipoprotein A